MRDTTLRPDGGPASRLAVPYNAKLQPVPNEGLGALNGAGGLYSTVNDMLRFIELFLGRGPQSLARQEQRCWSRGDPVTVPTLEWDSAGESRRAGRSDNVEQRSCGRLSGFHGLRSRCAGRRRRTDECSDQRRRRRHRLARTGSESAVIRTIPGSLFRPTRWSDMSGATCSKMASS